MPLTNAIFYVDGERAPIFTEADGYFVVRDSVEFMVPTGTLFFKDLNSAFFQHYPFLQDTEIEVYLQDKENSLKTKFYPFASSGKKPLEAYSENYFARVNLISEYSKDLLSSGEYSSRREKASDYVKYIADKLGFETDIEETKETRNWINPNWKYSQMIKYLATHSVSVSGSSGYLYFVNTEGVLHFKSIDRCFEESSDSERIIVDFTSSNIKEYKVSSNLFSTVLLGYNRLDLTSFDMTTGEDNTIVYSHKDGLKKRGKSSGISTLFRDYSRPQYVGEFFSSEENNSINIYPELFKRTMGLSEQNVITLTLADNPFGRSVGDVVNLDIKNVVAKGSDLNYSGRYLIKSIITKGNIEYYQTLVLVRKGINVDRDSVE